jgi:hypothetical protein
MEEIKAYRTYDGRIFTIKEEAEKEEKLIVARKALNEFVENFYYRNMDSSDIVKIILENRVIVSKILNF